MSTLKNTLKELGITQEMISACQMPHYVEGKDLVNAGEDMYGRTQEMTAATLDCWQKMRAAASHEGIALLLVSAYRSVDYQCDVIRNKLEAGRDIREILSVNAIPGHSEHHTGCALDLHSGDGEPLESSFENTEAFRWLTENASRFGFYLSYPRHNPDGIAYEPWHWCCREADNTA